MNRLEWWDDCTIRVVCKDWDELRRLFKAVYGSEWVDHMELCPAFFVNKFVDKRHLERGYTDEYLRLLNIMDAEGLKFES